MESMKCVIKNGQWGQWWKGFKLPANFLYNMVKIFANTSSALTPSRPQSTRWVSSTGKGPVHIPNRKGAMQKTLIRAPYQKGPQKMPGALALPL